MRWPPWVKVVRQKYIGVHKFAIKLMSLFFQWSTNMILSYLQLKTFLPSFFFLSNQGRNLVRFLSDSIFDCFQYCWTAGSVVWFGLLQMHLAICFHLKEDCHAKQAFTGKSVHFKCLTCPNAWSQSIWVVWWLLLEDSDPMWREYIIKHCIVVTRCRDEDWMWEEKQYFCRGCPCLFSNFIWHVLTYEVV